MTSFQCKDRLQQLAEVWDLTSTSATSNADTPQEQLGNLEACFNFTIITACILDGSKECAVCTCHLTQANDVDSSRPGLV